MKIYGESTNVCALAMGPALKGSFADFNAADVVVGRAATKERNKRGLWLKIVQLFARVYDVIRTSILGLMPCAEVPARAFAPGRGPKTAASRPSQVCY